MILNGRFLCYFFQNYKKLSLHMAQISEQVNTRNEKMLMIKWEKYLLT